MGTDGSKINKQGTTEETTQGGIGRRDFLKTAAIGAVGMGAMASFLGCSPSGAQSEAKADEAPAAAEAAPTAAPVAGASDLTGWAGTPAEIVALGGSTMPLADLNRYRQEYLDAQTDFTCEDGTVIPAAYVKMRALIHTYGMGCGSVLYDGAFGGMMKKFSEDDALAFIEMPFGEKFTPIDLAEKTGRSLEQCTDICERVAAEGYLCRFENNNGISYHQVPFFQGVVEYHLSDVMNDPTFNIGVATPDMLPGNMATTGTPTFYAIPCDKSVVNDGTVLPFDDVESLFVGKKTLAIAPCYCRLTAIAKSGEADCPTLDDFLTGEYSEYFSPLVDQRVETCLMVGDEAEYWIHRGFARAITPEEALGFMQRSRDDGFILQSCFSKDTGTICSCHADSCGIVAQWMSLGGFDEIGASTPFERISHYNLEVSMSDCIKCGTCAARCPMHVITMDGEGGAPVVADACFRCGQCAWVCPQEARKLVLRPEDEILELPRDFLDDNNMKAAYRFEQGLIV